MFKEVRRQNRLLEDQNRINELLSDSEYGFLSLGLSANGYAYGIPLSYAYDKETNCIYFHCAPEGEKLEILKRNDKVTFCIVGVTKPIAQQFTTLYESLIIFAESDIHLSDDEKRKALRLLVDKYSPEFQEMGEKYIEKSWNRTATFKIKIQHFTGKAKYQ